MSLDDAARIHASADVVARVLDGEAILLDLASGTYFGLNAVGTRAWEILSGGVTLGQLRAVLLEEFEVEEARLERDVADLIDALITRGLVKVGAS